MKASLIRRSALFALFFLLFVLSSSQFVSAEDRFTIEDSNDWSVTLIDTSTGENSGNNTAFEGDRLLLSIEIENSDTTAGHDEWVFHMVVDGQESPELTGFLDGSQELVIVNITFSPLPEGFVNLVFSIDSTGESDSLILLVQPNPLNLTPAGAAEVALIGEPIHAGDDLTASIMVHNQGTSPQLAQLQLSTNDQDPILGNSIMINPGSSREVSATIYPQEIGSSEINWRVLSPDEGVSQELNGTVTVEVLSKQSLNLVVDSVIWTLDDGLSTQFSAYLSDGRTRDVLVEVAFLEQTIETIVQTFELKIDPGRRPIEIDFGTPPADSLIIRLEAIGWTPLSDIEITVPLSPPVLELSIEISNPNPLNPLPNQMVIIPFNLTNQGNAATLTGEVRAVRASDGMLLDSLLVSEVNSGASLSGNLDIQSWPDSNVIEVEVIWLTGTEQQKSLIEIVSYSEEDTGLDLPFDLTAAIYGIIIGIVLVMFILVIQRTLSESVAETGASRFNKIRESRSIRKKAAAATKREIPCPECDQRLSIPSSHSGSVRCPACTSRFDVDSEAESTTTLEEKISSEEVKSNNVVNELVVYSTDDFLSCPSCDQTLRIILEKRPVKARCPACRCEFVAGVSQDG